MGAVDDVYRAQARLVAEDLGLREEDASARLKRVVYGEWEATLDRVPLYAGMRETLEILRGWGLRVGILSDFPLSGKLEKYRLSAVFDCRVEAEEVGFLKPNPEPFIALLNCLGSKPERTLYVGNSYEYDVVGATSAGMPTAHLVERSAPKYRNVVPDLTFRDYDTLLGWLKPRVASDKTAAGYD